MYTIGGIYILSIFEKDVKDKRKSLLEINKGG